MKALLNWITSFAFALAPQIRAQESEALDIAGMTRVLRSPTQRTVRPVVFHGVVNHRSKQLGGIFIQDESGGVFVWPPPGVENPPLGAEVEVTAEIQFTTTSIDTEVQAKSLRVLGQPGPSQPVSATIAEVVAGKFNRRAVQVEATVLQSEEGRNNYRGIQWLMLADKSGLCMAGVYQWPAGWNPESLAGKTIRFRGICAGSGLNALRCSTLDEITEIPADSALPKVFTSAQEVTEFVPASDRSLHAVKLRGVCTFPSLQRNYFSIHDGVSDIIVQTNHPDQCPALGDEVEVSGISLWAAGVPAIKAFAARRIGVGKLPEPLRVEPGKVVSPKNLSRWLETEGIILQARGNPLNSIFQLHVVNENGWGIATVNHLPNEIASEALVGARVRLRGIASLATLAVDGSNSAECFTVLAPSSGLPFAVFTAPGATRKHATVVAVEDHWIYARDSAGAFRAQMATAFRDESQWSRAVHPLLTPSLKAGQIADFNGLPTKTGMVFAQAQHVGEGGKTDALPAKLSDAASGVQGNDLVKFFGRMRDYRRSAGQAGEWTELLRLEQDGAEIEVILDTASSAPELAGLTRDDRIEVTGLVQPENGLPAWRLRLRTAHDARSLGIAPEVLRERNLRILWVIIGILAVGLSIIIFMARKLANARLLVAERARADSAVRELNSALERRVTERTAELEKTQAELRGALAAERELVQLKSNFVSMVSHELRTPLEVVLTSADILDRYLDRLPAEDRLAHLRAIQASTKRMAGMMESVLVLGRLDAGRLECNPTDTHIPALCNRLLDEMRSATAGRCPIELELGNFEPLVNADTALLRHIFTNIISNAVKYSMPGAPVKFSVVREGDDLVFRVSDHGIGIPAEDKARLFEAFHRGANAGETPGTGLGLVIVKRCVDLHRGTITFTSEAGAGTTFVVRLPVFENEPT